MKKNDYIFQEISTLKGVGIKLSRYLKNKKIEKINDLLWNLPYSYTDRSVLVKSNSLEIGKILTIKLKIIKYNFPRIRNLPKKIIAKDDVGEVDIVYFNAREGYLRKILPIGEWVVVSGKISIYKNRYQLTNPDYVTKIDNISYVNKVIPKYSLSEGLNEKIYRKIIDQVIDKLPEVNEWLDNDIIAKFNFPSWKKSMSHIHLSIKDKDINSPYYKRLAFDEIFCHLLVLSENRKKIKKIKKIKKEFNETNSNIIKKNLPFILTEDQNKVIDEINIDLKSNNKMFRVLQGDVGSGKTIVSLITAANVIENNFQCALMAPTEILASQHFNLSKTIFKNTKIKISLLTGKVDVADRRKIIKDLENGKIDLLIGTHAIFQKKIIFKKLGFIIIDEQHKFGVKQRMALSKKGGDNCDILLMSATPIPRTMMLTIYGDMDISKINKKPLNRKNILTLSKPENKIDELWPFIKKQLKNDNQIFWVCPLIEDSKFLDYSSAVKKFKIIEKRFPGKVGLIHGALEKSQKETLLKKFLKKEIKILVSTTVIEVGIDFPNANLIIIENANKFGLAQLHQLRGRVGRGEQQGICILLFKDSLSKNAIERLKILKSTNDGFLIAEEDMRLRGYGDIIGFKQSGIKYFKIADPIHHKDLFKVAENYFQKNFNISITPTKYDFLMKLFDKAEVININFED